MLVHEATFAEEEAERARETNHSTARQAAELAREAEVRLLALTHLSSRYGGGELRDEARAIFANTVAPRDFDTIEIPFPERGPADAAALGRPAGPRGPGRTAARGGGDRPRAGQGRGAVAGGATRDGQAQAEAIPSS